VSAALQLRPLANCNLRSAHRLGVRVRLALRAGVRYRVRRLAERARRLRGGYRGAQAARRRWDSAGLPAACAATLQRVRCARCTRRAAVCTHRASASAGPTPAPGAGDAMPGVQLSSSLEGFRRDPPSPRETAPAQPAGRVASVRAGALATQ
jgi:hypothetical protein